MNHIAVCDDEPLSQDMLCGLLDQFPFPVSHQCFSTGEALLEACGKGARFDLIFMDIELNNGSPEGIQLAAQVKALLPEAVLIFVSGYPQYITQALRVKPDQFLLKPVVYEELLEVVLSALEEKRHSAAERKLYFTFKGSKLALYPQEIYYLESSKHSIIVYAQGHDPFSIISTMEEQEKRLLPLSFVKIHRSYLVNLRHIHQIQGAELILDNNLTQKLPVSRRYRAELAKRYTAYMHTALERLT